MHVLFLSRPDHDHLYLTLAVAEELGRRGHAVTFATSDPFAEEDAASGVVLLRYGRDERILPDLPAFAGRGPADLVVCDPRTHRGALELGRVWGARVVVAHTNLAAGGAVPLPAERSFGADYVYVHPAGRGTVHGDWEPADRRPVLAVAHPGLPAGLLAAFPAADWQVVVIDPPGGPEDRDLTAGIARASGFPALAHADVLLIDGALPAVAAGLRHATPMVLAPGTLEQRRDAARVAGLGLGALVQAGEQTPETLLRVVSRLSADEMTRAALRRVRALVRDAGAPARVSDVLEAELRGRHLRAA